MSDGFPYPDEKTPGNFAYTPVPSTAPEDGLVRVTQADREAAASLRDGLLTVQAAMRAGEMDYHNLVQAFTRHRAEGEAAATERAAKVAAMVAHNGDTTARAIRESRR